MLLGGEKCKTKNACQNRVAQEIWDTAFTFGPLGQMAVLGATAGKELTTESLATNFTNHTNFFGSIPLVSMMQKISGSTSLRSCNS